MMSGINASTYYSIKEKFPLLRIIISGGISSVEDIEEIDFRKIDGVIVGKAIYEGKIKLEELSRCCRKE